MILNDECKCDLKRNKTNEHLKTGTGKELQIC
jgi:hypothetical protein